MKFVYWFFIVIYVLSAVVQYNDPDPLVWIASYLVPAFMCYYRLKGKGDRVQYVAIGLVYLLWSINQFPPEWEGLMIDHLSMKTINVELGRESLGLGMCTVGLWICALGK